MNEKENRIQSADMLDDVVSKLCALRDFMQAFDKDFIMHKNTPFGLNLILGECIDSLNQIGGFYVRSGN